MASCQIGICTGSYVTRRRESPSLLFDKVWDDTATPRARTGRGRRGRGDDKKSRKPHLTGKKQKQAAPPFEQAVYDQFPAFAA